MSQDDGLPADDEPLGRPFLGGVPGRPSPWPAPERAAAAPQQDEIRPYLLTGGRTHAGDAVAMETVVLATGTASARRSDPAGSERTAILRLAGHPCSAAEVAARLQLPLQVALVLVTDLVTEGLLDATAVGSDQADDVPFLERLIAGVAAL